MRMWRKYRYDEKTIAFRLAAPNVAFLDYMTMAVLPRHLLEGEDLQESGSSPPVGTGPYMLESWDAGQSIVLVKNEGVLPGQSEDREDHLQNCGDDNAQALQLKSGELDMALLDPKNARNFAVLRALPAMI